MQLLLGISFHFVHLDLDTFIWPSPFSWFEIHNYHRLQGKSVIVSLEGIHTLGYEACGCILCNNFGLLGLLW